MLLLVDDDDVLRERLGRALRERGLAVALAKSFDTALAAARGSPPDLAVVDLKMPGRSGLDLVPELLKLNPGVRIVVLTGYSSVTTAIEAIRRGAVHYLPKPADADDVLAAFSKGAPSPGAPVEPETPSLARAEWEHIDRVLADCGGNVSEAARRLGIHRRSLQRKLQKFPPRR